MEIWKQFWEKETPQRFQPENGALIGQAIDQTGLAVSEHRLPPPLPAGIEIVHVFQEATDTFRCAQYAFATYHHEPWAREDTMFPHDLFGNTEEYLARRGYSAFTQKEYLQNGDIIAYRNTDGKRIHTLHFGVWNDGDVFSKYGDIHVLFRHKLTSVFDRVEYHDVNDVIFFRKTQDIYLVQPELRSWGYYLPKNEQRELFDRSENDDRLLRQLNNVQIYKNIPQENQDSASFLFKTLLKTPDVMPGEWFTHTFYNNPMAYLKRQGWEITLEPQNGDIVLYGTEGQAWTSRFGLLQDGKVISKSHFSPVIHDFDYVPNLEGNAVRFMRKVR